MIESVYGGLYGSGDARTRDPERNYRRFLAHLRQRRAQRRPVVIVIDGKETSVGKSALGISICRDLDPNFGLEKVVYSAQELHTGYGNVEPSMFLYDDVTGLLSKRGARDEEMQGLVSAVSIVRKNGHGTLFLAPKKELLDGLILTGLANFWIFCEERGRARVHRAYIGAKYRRSQPRVPFDTWNAVTPLTWPNLDDDPFFRAYNDRAIERNREYFRMRALDPSGRLKECPKCKQLGSAWKIATHDCLGSAAATEEKTGTGEGVAPRSVSPVAKPPPPPRQTEWTCGAIVFRRKEHYDRHLNSRTHLYGRCGGAR